MQAAKFQQAEMEQPTALIELCEQMGTMEPQVRRDPSADIEPPSSDVEGDEENGDQIQERPAGQEGAGVEAAGREAAGEEAAGMETATAHVEAGGNEAADGAAVDQQATRRRSRRQRVDPPAPLQDKTNQMEPVAHPTPVAAVTQVKKKQRATSKKRGATGSTGNAGQASKQSKRQRTAKKTLAEAGVFSSCNF